jgi:PAS domain S-box-containing protein
LRVTLASIGDAVITTDTEGRVTFLNPVAEFLTGWTQGDAAGLSLESVFKIVNQETRRPVESPTVRALRDGVIVGLANHTLLISKDGTERPIDDSASPIRNDKNEVAGVVLIFRDISDRKWTQFSEQRLAAIVDSSDDAIISKSLQGIIQSWNAAAERLFGYNAKEALGRHISILIPADRLPEEDQIISRIRAGERVDHMDTVRLRKDGQPVQISLTVSPVRDADGRVIGASKIARDITERKRLEQANVDQLNAARLLSAIVDSSDDAIISKSLEGMIQSWNAAAERLFGYTAAEAIGQHISILIPADRLSEESAIIAQIKAGERVDHMDTVRLRKNGQPVQISLTVSPVRDANGRVVGASKIARDITERKRLEDELRQAAAAMSENDRRKNEFVAMLAHELRNPLAPIRNAVQVLRLTTGLSASVQVASEMMERQIGQMVRMVDDLLDVSRVSQGKIELRKGRIELASAVNHAVEAARSLAQCLDHDLTVTLPSQPIFLYADPTRLSQVVGNLLNNACKFTDKGGRIALIVERNGGQAVIRVRDNGIGIPADKLPDIFDMFMQIDTSLERTISGLGIGLTLVKKLVEMHDGTVEVHSAGLGQGSEFVVRLPILVESCKPATPEPTVSEPITTIARRILVVDDNRDSADSLAMLLTLTGNETHTAYDGLEAVETAGSVKPDVIFMDIGLPKLNGYEAARKVREQPWGKKLVLVALTGWGQEGDRQKAREAGFDSHLVKPVDYAALKMLLAELPATTA